MGETSETSETSDVPRGAPGGVRTDSGETDHDSRTEAGGSQPASGSQPDRRSHVGEETPTDRSSHGEDNQVPPDERVDDDGVIIDAGDEEEDPAAAEARRTVLGEAVPESAITRHETERGDAVEYEIDPDAIPFADDDTDDDEDDEDDSGGFLGRLFRS
jgi:septum site-determining protein MinD